MKGYIKTIPYQFYPIVAIIISFLVAIFILPDLGAMKKSELMSKDKEQLKNSEKKEEQISIWYFFIPIIVLIIVIIVSIGRSFGLCLQRIGGVGSTCVFFSMRMLSFVSVSSKGLASSSSHPYPC